MACACKVNQQLSYLQKKYGTESPGSKKTDIRTQVKLWFYKALISIITFTLMPFLLLITFINRKGPINISKVFRLSPR